MILTLSLSIQSRWVSRGSTTIRLISQLRNFPVINSHFLIHHSSSANSLLLFLSQPPQISSMYIICFNIIPEIDNLSLDFLTFLSRIRCLLCQQTPQQLMPWTAVISSSLCASSTVTRRTRSKSRHNTRENRAFRALRRVQLSQRR